MEFVMCDKALQQSCKLHFDFQYCAKVVRSPLFIFQPHVLVILEVVLSKSSTDFQKILSGFSLHIGNFFTHFQTQTPNPLQRNLLFCFVLILFVTHKVKHSTICSQMLIAFKGKIT